MSTLMSVKTTGLAGGLDFTVLCSYANFRTSYLLLEHGKVVKYKICDWKQHNTVLDYNCPCQKDTGFFFMPVTAAAELIGSGHCSEMDIILDLWISTVYNDVQVQGSEAGPVVYLHSGTGSPLVTYHELAARWGLSKATVGRLLKKLHRMDYISLLTFPGRTGTVIYLKSYLSTMFQISDVLVDKDEIAMILNIHLTLPDKADSTEDISENTQDIIVSEELSNVSKPHIEIIIEKLAKILDSQGVSCFQCPKAKYKLSPLLSACKEADYIRAREGHSLKYLELSILCSSEKPAVP